MFVLGILDNADATGLGCAMLASNFTIEIDTNQSEIISPNPEYALIYSQKYSHWLSLQ